MGPNFEFSRKLQLALLGITRDNCWYFKISHSFLIFNCKQQLNKLVCLSVFYFVWHRNLVKQNLRCEGQHLEYFHASCKELLSLVGFICDGTECYFCLLRSSPWSLQFCLTCDVNVNFHFSGKLQLALGITVEFQGICSSRFQKDKGSVTRGLYWHRWVLRILFCL